MKRPPVPGVKHRAKGGPAVAELLRRLGRDADAEPVERDLLSMLSEADADHVIAARLRAVRRLPAARETLNRTL